MSFYHPRPTWSPHILLVPKRGIPSFVALRPKDYVLVVDIVRLAEDIVARLAPVAASYVLLVNGGALQDVGQLHFHLTWGVAASRYACPGDTTGEPILQTEQVEVFQHPHPTYAIHLVLCPRRNGTDPGTVIAVAKRVVRDLNLQPGGFRFALGTRHDRTGTVQCFHLVSGAAMEPAG